MLFIYLFRGGGRCIISTNKESLDHLNLLKLLCGKLPSLVFDLIASQNVA